MALKWREKTRSLIFKEPVKISLRRPALFTFDWLGGFRSSLVIEYSFLLDSCHWRDHPVTFSKIKFPHFDIIVFCILFSLIFSLKHACWIGIGNWIIKPIPIRCPAWCKFAQRVRVDEASHTSIIKSRPII